MAEPPVSGLGDGCAVAVPVTEAVPGATLEKVDVADRDGAMGTPPEPLAALGKCGFGGRARWEDRDVCNG